MATEKIKITDIAPDPKNRSGNKIPELATSIKQVGLMHPVVVKATGKTSPKYVVVAGHRRLAACIMLGWTHVDCTVVEDKDTDLLRLAENVSRQDLAPFQMAEEVDSLVQRGYKITEIAHVTGYSISAIAQYARLKPSLCSQAWELFVSEGRKAKISEWFAMMPLTPESQRERLFGDRAAPRGKRSRVTRPMVAAKLRQLDATDGRVKMLRWFLGEIHWKDTGE